MSSELVLLFLHSVYPRYTALVSKVHDVWRIGVPLFTTIRL